MWIVDVKPNRTEEILNTHVVCVHTVDEILIPPTDNNLDRKHSKSIHLNDQSLKVAVPALKAAVCKHTVSVRNNEVSQSEKVLTCKHKKPKNGCLVESLKRSRLHTAP